MSQQLQPNALLISPADIPRSRASCSSALAGKPLHGAQDPQAGRQDEELLRDPEQQPLQVDAACI